MKFSIIVPIYNVEQYLDACLDSILTQEYSDYELLLVDDGSTDNCPQICDEYSTKDNRITVIHQKNGGVSTARNNGLFSAKGDYIIFVDSDDLLYPNALEKLSICIDRNPDIDILIGNFIYWEDDLELILYDNKQFISEQEGKDILSLNEVFARNKYRLPWEPYHSAYKRTFLLENELYFRNIGAEDCEFYIRVIEKAPKYVLTDIILVKYRANRAGSLTTKRSYKVVMGELKVFSDAFIHADMFKDTKLMRRYFADHFAGVFIQINMIEDQRERERCFQFVKEHKDILKYTSISPKFVFARIFWRIFGFQKGSDILLKIKNIRS